MIRTLCLAAFVWMVAFSARADVVKMAVTTSFENAGLADVLLPEIANDIGVTVQLIVVGTGQALRLGAAGDVDAVLVHAKQAEEAFVVAGHATHRTPFMYNDFVVVGPRNDPAQVAKTADALNALSAILAAKAPFVSRGDESGTHQAEQRLWAEVGQDPADFGRWYRSVGAGMGAALNTAAGLNAYILADRGSWVNFQNKGTLALLFEGDPRLYNQYSFLPINPANHPHVAADAVARLERWLTGQRAADLIDGYRVAGQQLFNFNATAQ